MGSSFPSSGSSASEPSQEGSQPAERQLLPLTVWLCPDADRPASGQDPAGGGGLCFRHRYAVGRELARHLITCCTRPNDLVVDAYTCSDATLSAAAELGRWAMGCVPYPPLAHHLGARLRDGIPSPALGWVGIRPVAAECLASGLSDIAGKVRLIVAAPPELDLRRERSSQVARPVSPGCQACQGQARWISEGQLRSFLLGCRKILAPGGHLAVVTTARHASGRLVDPAPVIIRDAARLGLAYTQHVVAVRVPVAGNDLVVQAGPEELAQLRRPGSTSPPPAARVHADVCLFTKPVKAREPNGGGTR